MIIQTKQTKRVFLNHLVANDFGGLCEYLQKLSAETLRRFGPHKCDYQSIVDFYSNQSEYFGYVAKDEATGDIVAYSIIKIGFLEHDKQRLESYGLQLNNKRDSTFAPSVADEWQGSGVGTALFNFIAQDLKLQGIKRIILWGGVQSDNERAVIFYNRNGFRLLGHFEYNGLNDDMILELTDIL